MATVQTSPYFPVKVPEDANEGRFSGSLGMYGLVDITSKSTDNATVNYNFENPRNKPQEILIPCGPSVPFLPPHEDYNPEYTMTTTDIFRRGAYLQSIPQFLNLCDSYPSLVFGPIADHSVFKEWASYSKDSLKVMGHCEDALFLGCPQDLLINELQNELEWRGIQWYTNHLYYGGCLSFVPTQDNNKKVAGFLLYPSGASMDILTITTISPYVEKSMVRLTPKPENGIQQFKLGGVIRQIESRAYPECNVVYSIIRTDYQCYLVRTGLSEDGDLTSVTIIRTLNLQHRLTSVALSPFIKEEFVCALDSNDVILSDTNGRLLRTGALTNVDSRINPIFCHFGGHPREVFIHHHKEVFLYDFRSSSKAKKILLQLPDICLPSNQCICVAKQHPSNPFYHFLATQDTLLLLDQRFPQHAVLQTCHNVKGFPSYLEVSSYNQAENMDIIMVGNHSNRQIHCTFIENKKMSQPRSSSLPWKISPYQEWVQVQVDLEIWERLHEPLLGVAAGPVSVNGTSSWNVLQISAAGDLFYQMFSSPTSDVSHRIISDSSLGFCDLWLKSVGHDPEKTVTAERCSTISGLEYQGSCRQCFLKECILGDKMRHGLKNYAFGNRQKSPLPEETLEKRKEQLRELWEPLVCENCCRACVKDLAKPCDNRLKLKGHLNCLKLPWEDSIEESKPLVKVENNEAEIDSVKQPSSQKSLTNQLMEDSLSSRIISQDNSQVSQSNFVLTPDDEILDESETSFYMFLKNNKMTTKRKHSGNSQLIGF